MIKFRIPLSVEIRCKQRHEIRMLAVPIFCCCLFSRPQLLYAICTFFSNAVCAFIILSRRRSIMQGKTNLLNLAGDMSWMLSIWRMASLPFFFFFCAAIVDKKVRNCGSSHFFCVLQNSMLSGISYCCFLILSVVEKFVLRQQSSSSV